MSQSPHWKARLVIKDAKVLFSIIRSNEGKGTHHSLPTWHFCGFHIKYSPKALVFKVYSPPTGAIKRWLDPEVSNPINGLPSTSSCLHGLCIEGEALLGEEIVEVCPGRTSLVPGVTKLSSHLCVLSSCRTIFLYTMKICCSHWFNKELNGQKPGRKRSGRTREEPRDEEGQGRQETRGEARWACMLKKGTEPYGRT